MTEGDFQMGVLMSDGRYEGLLAGEAEAWRQISLAQERRLGVRTVALPVQTVDPDAETVRAALPTPLGWKETEVRTPRVYFNQLVRSSVANSRALRTLNGDLRVLVFNETNRWNRGMVFNILERFPGLRDLVPPTVAYRPENTEFLFSGPGPYLLAGTQRPLREKAYILEWVGPSTLWWTRLPDGASGSWERSDLPAGLQEVIGPEIRWVTRLPGHPTGPDTPAEWRVYLHRDRLGGWRLAGAVAKHDLLRTGTSRERCWDFDQALGRRFGQAGAELGDRLKSASLEMADALTLFLPGIAHCAMDFWVDCKGHPMLADLSGRYRVDWLRRLGDEVALQQVFNHPTEFTRTLEETGVRKLDVGFGRAGFPTRGRNAASRPLLDGAR